jgi:hypothetical protein
MPLTLDQYASWLDKRGLPWPAPPIPKRPKAKAHLRRLPEVRAVLWNVYGTLLAIPGGELLFEHPTPFVMSNALDKTIQEFKMWASMSRKPGQPAEYLGHLYSQLLAEQRVAVGAERRPEPAVDRLWEAVIKRLLQKDYQFDAGFYGSLNEFSRKVAYFFHASLQATAAQESAAVAFQHVADAGRMQGLLADGQCFTLVQLRRGLAAQDAAASLDDLLAPDLRLLSYEVGVAKPSKRLFHSALAALEKRGVAAAEVLHVGSHLTRDLAPARRLGMRTALYAGDGGSLHATRAQLKDSATRPDVLMTDLSQIEDVIG